MVEKRPLTLEGMKMMKTMDNGSSTQEVGAETWKGTKRLARSSPFIRSFRVWTRLSELVASKAIPFELSGQRQS
ncbi:hypothetical protein SLEP1_g21307 [Rubroshorea leprosula]|uniref:Uncharacterized protein n=1 Tax=Rubroshorea leprosula TaxID=152421 RepID=A0AAV5JBJ4_9ROSI|nr:hypothetical protein SLEP1_g21307 [Rubroshorea leprosula]